ncbi:MAG TPA: endonuclease/exonuclease/phosphatase family protein [Pirellulales bacterium]|nr:endonuclease/exonuclease/phosphatase family protein [Pirellulales bacterium]
MKRRIRKSLPEHEARGGRSAVSGAPSGVTRLDRPVTSPFDPPAKRGRRRAAAVLGLVVASGLIYYSGDQRRAVSPAAGDSLLGNLGASPDDRATIRVATFNIHGGVGDDRRLNLARTAEALKEFDLVLLNEVHGPSLWQTKGQAEQLAQLAGKRWLFAPTEERWWHHRFGNAVLASANVGHWHTIGLPAHGRGQRNLVLMSVQHGGRTIHVVGTHLDRSDPRDRAEQFRAATGLFLSLAEPAILLGDLNTTADEDCLRTLLDRPDVHDPLGETRRGAVPPRIDWLLTRGLKTVNAGIVDNGASDHPLIWAELE